tara:strand:+ start:3461 stop:4747 length:1287 start_codon:yes stop_codon:yes gene_type:complete
MPVQGRTREQLRQSIGFNLGALKTGTATSGTTETLIDTKTLRGGDDTYNGKLILVTDASDGTTQDTPFIDDYTSSSTTIAFQHALSFTVASGDTYEIWDSPYEPTKIHDFINQAIIDVTGQAYDPIEYPDMSSSPHTALFADGKTLRFDIPSNISIINRIYYRSSITSTILHSCNSAFDETIDSDFTVTVDTEDKKRGTGSNKFVIAVGASAGDIATDSITSKNISKYDYLECWVKSTVATSAGNIKILLDDSANCASPLETLSVPALSADTWTYVRIALANPELNTAIISIGLEYDSDLGACQIRLDDIKVVKNDTAVFQIFPRHLWKLDRSARDLVLTEGGMFESGYSMLKLTGGDKPALLSSESSTTEIDDSYIVARATGLAFSAASGGPSTDPDALRQAAAFWFGLAEQSKRAFPLLITGRVVE